MGGVRELLAVVVIYEPRGARVLRGTVVIMGGAGRINLVIGSAVGEKKLKDGNTDSPLETTPAASNSAYC
jgi:hypothetical protein